MVISSKKIGGTASALSIPPRISVIMTKLAPQRSLNCRKKVGRGGRAHEHTTHILMLFCFMYLQEGSAGDARLCGERGVGAGGVLHAEDSLGPVAAERAARARRD